MPLVTEDWSKRRWQPGKSAARVFQVSGVGDERAAISACASQCAEGKSFPKEAALVAERPDVSVRNPDTTAGHYELSFAFVPMDQKDQDKPENRQVGKMKVRVGFKQSQDPADFDADGNAVLNTVGDPCDPQAPMDHIDPVLHVYRYESAFEVAQALAYINKVNSDAITIPDVGPLRGGRVDAGQMLCELIEPTDDISDETETVLVHYQFAFREDGHQFRMPNLGFNGWYSDNGVTRAGKITVRVNGSVKEASFPVRLDNIGMPMEATYQVSGSAPVKPAQQFVPAALLEKSKDGKAWFIRYKRCKSISFAGLSIFQ